MGNVVLIGYRGAGKSTVGALLADRLGLEFVDTDAIVVERAGKSISAIFSDDGEPVFRELEARAIVEVADRPALVLSAGGGAVLREDNVQNLRACGTVFWLDADADTLWSRIRGDASSGVARPPLTGRLGLDEVRHVLGEREVRYRACAHHRIDVTDLTPGQTAEGIEQILRRAGSLRNGP